MNFVALKMLLGDRAKYLSLIFTVAFASYLLANQVSIFCGILLRTASQIIDVPDADLWVMDRETQYFDESKALTDNDLYRVRGVQGVSWAVKLYKGFARATAPDGKFRQVILMGLDDATLVGAPRRMLLGRFEDLQDPDAVIIDRAGYAYFFPGEPLAIGKTFEFNDHRARLVGIAEASAPFATFPVFFTRYSLALNYVGRERNLLAYVLGQGPAERRPGGLKRPYRIHYRPAGGYDRGVHVADHRLLPQQYRHPRELRDHYCTSLPGGSCGGGPDLLSLHP